ncbi:LysE family translocator [Arthrobacter woluwensis]|uniref:LysE family translocator n=1 Tax=Arthrobacter woluwensis TaxID=156980 RepID=UPI0009F44F89|nr:LysE family transporter [Arthrobacter woluwensis]
MTLEQSLLGFAALSVLITILPGTDTALVLRYALGRSRRHAYTAALGMITGAFIWGVAAATGVSALLAVSTVAYDILRIIGAGYMLWLAFSFWRASFHGRGQRRHHRRAGHRGARTPREDLG